MITTLDVVLRYIFNAPLPGVFILCEMLMVGAVYLSISYVQQRKGHVRVDIFIDKLKGNPRNAVEIATLLVSLAGFGIMFWKTGEYAWEAWITEDHAMGLIKYPFWPAKAALSIGVGLLCVRLILDLRHYFTDLIENSHAQPDRKKEWIIWSVLAFVPLAGLSLFLLTGSFGLKFEPLTVGWTILVIMILLLLAGLPISFALLAMAIIGYWILAGPKRTFSILGTIPYDKIANYTLSVVPLFILMGNLAFHAGFANSMYATIQKWIGRIPGGMAHATIIGGAAFGAACGSGLASCATLAKVCIPAMRSVGVDPKLAVGSVAAAGPLAQMIPPSIVMVIYAMLTEQSVAKLLIAGIIPGIVAAINFMIFIYIRCRLNPQLAPPIREEISWKDRVVSLKNSWGIAMIALIVMGGIYTGIFTPTEAGALGAFSSLVLGSLNRKLKWANLKEALMDSIKTTSMIFLIISTALIFGSFLGISRIPAALSDLLIGLEVHRLAILCGILLMYIIAGAFIDMLPFAFLTIPIIYPTILALGFDPIWFGVIIVHMFELALITPPFGLNLFILRGMVPDVSMPDIIRSVGGFVVMDIFILIQYVAFPQLATWLPSKM